MNQVSGTVTIGMMCHAQQAEATSRLHFSGRCILKRLASYLSLNFMLHSMSMIRMIDGFPSTPHSLRIKNYYSQFLTSYH